MKKIHGRTANALLIRLDRMGLGSAWLQTEDGPGQLSHTSPVLTPTSAAMPPTPQKAPTMKMTTKRLIALLQVFDMDREATATCSETAANLNTLAMAGLLAKQPSGGFLVSSAGRATVESLVASVSSAPASRHPSIEQLSPDSACAVLAPQRLYIAVPGVCAEANPERSNSPIDLLMHRSSLRVHSSLHAAETSAQNQANEEIGVPVFVFQAVSSHKVSLTPAEVTRL